MHESTTEEISQEDLIDAGLIGVQVQRKEEKNLVGF